MKFVQNLGQCLHLFLTRNLNFSKPLRKYQEKRSKKGIENELRN